MKALIPTLRPGGFWGVQFIPATDKSPWFGKEFTVHDGTTYRLVRQNDLHVGYWVKVVRGKPQKKMYAADIHAPTSFWQHEEE